MINYIIFYITKIILFSFYPAKYHFQLSIVHYCVAAMRRLRLTRSQQFNIESNSSICAQRIKIIAGLKSEEKKTIVFRTTKRMLAGR